MARRPQRTRTLRDLRAEVEAAEARGLNTPPAATPRAPRGEELVLPPQADHPAPDARRLGCLRRGGSDGRLVPVSREGQGGRPRSRSEGQGQGRLLRPVGQGADQPRIESRPLPPGQPMATAIAPFCPFGYLPPPARTTRSEIGRRSQGNAERNRPDHCRRSGHVGPLAGLQDPGPRLRRLERPRRIRPRPSRRPRRQCRLTPSPSRP